MAVTQLRRAAATPETPVASQAGTPNSELEMTWMMTGVPLLVRWCSR